MRSFAFFDLDHTLLPFDTQVLFCNFILRHQRWRTLWHLAFLPCALLRAMQLVPTSTAKRAFMSYLTGMRRETLQARAKEFAERVVNPAIYPVMREELEKQRAAGRLLVLNSASPDFYVGEIARVLGFDHFIATRIEVFATLPFLPRMIGQNNKREVKIARMKAEVPEFAAANDTVLRDSWSYSDSEADL
ncbi:MAG TPA: HAD-IB family phosphatase, partial [Verrucomicrobiaceae bacterium]